MIVAQLEKSFVYVCESSDHVDDDVWSSHLSDLSHANFDDFKYEGSEVWMIEMNMNTTSRRWEKRRRHAETDSSGSSGSSDRASLKVNITSIPNATAWGGTVRLILQFLFSYFALLKIFH